MKFEEKFYEALKRYLFGTNRVVGIDKILSVVDDSGWTGGCETCSYYDASLIITYTLLNDPDTIKQYYYSGSFPELLEGLLQIEVD